MIVIAGEPDGLNINDGVGSTHLDVLRAAVLEYGADAGIAHDGDADRCLAIAADGSDVDGDAILAILAASLDHRGELAHSTVVGTVMANIGFHQAMAAAGITVVTTGVGDRYVLEEMRDGGFSLGGEQSGHVVLADQATTGDGVLTALHLLSEVAATGRTLAELASKVVRFPQVLINVRVHDKAAVADSVAVAAAVGAAQTELGDSGRLLLRPSGTEPAGSGHGRGPHGRAGQGHRRPGGCGGRPGLNRLEHPGSPCSAGYSARAVSRSLSRRVFRSSRVVPLTLPSSSSAS